MNGTKRNKSGPKADLIGVRIPLTVSVDRRTIEFLKIAGKGNVSHGVRVAARLAYDKYQREPE